MEKETISRIELLLQSGAKDLSKLITRYEFQRIDDKVFFTIRDFQAEDDDIFGFALHNFNEIFLVLQRGEDVYAMTLHPPIRSLFSHWDDGEVILDYSIHSSIDGCVFSVNFQVFPSIQRLPSSLREKHFGLKDAPAYGKFLKEKGVRGYREEFPLTISTSVDANDSSGGLLREKKYDIDFQEYGYDERGDFLKDVHVRTVKAVNAFLEENRIKKEETTDDTDCP